MCNDLFMRSLKLLHLCDALKTRCYAILSQERLLRSSCISSMHFEEGFECGTYSVPFAFYHSITSTQSALCFCTVASVRCTATCRRSIHAAQTTDVHVLHLSDALRARCYDGSMGVSCHSDTLHLLDALSCFPVFVFGFKHQKLSDRLRMRVKHLAGFDHLYCTSADA